jgi:hypothetical protein
MSTHKGQTDQVTTIKLESAIEQVYWTCRRAASGSVVGLEVFTRFVGNNSELKIELTDNNGKNFGTFSDKIHANHFWAPVKVPAEAKGALFASVKLPKHGLSGKSSPLLLLPLVHITNVKWDKSEVHRGEVLKLTADVKGAPEGTEAVIEIYEHDEDGANELVTKSTSTVRSNRIEAEWEYQYTGKTKDIPTAEETEKGYHHPQLFFRVSVGEVSADSGLLIFKDWIEIKLQDRRGNPMSGAEYVLHFADGSQKRSKLSAEGTAIEGTIPPGPCRLEFPGIDGQVSLAADEENHG